MAACGQRIITEKPALEVAPTALQQYLSVNFRLAFSNLQLPMSALVAMRGFHDFTFTCQSINCILAGTFIFVTEFNFLT